MASALEGVAALTAQLNEFGAKVAARELRGTTKTALAIPEHAARARMPVGTEPHKTYKGRIVSPGYSLSTLHIEVKLDKRTGSVVGSLGVGREAFYAVQFGELGTARMPAHPWLRPSFETSEEAMLQSIVTDLRARIAKLQKRGR